MKTPLNLRQWDTHKGDFQQTYSGLLCGVCQDHFSLLAFSVIIISWWFAIFGVFGGLSKTIWRFSENSSILAGRCFPISVCAYPRRQMSLVEKIGGRRKIWKKCLVSGHRSPPGMVTYRFFCLRCLCQNTSHPTSQLCALSTSPSWFLTGWWPTTELVVVFQQLSIMLVMTSENYLKRELILHSLQICDKKNIQIFLKQKFKVQERPGYKRNAQWRKVESSKIHRSHIYHCSLPAKALTHW